MTEQTALRTARGSGHVQFLPALTTTVVVGTRLPGGRDGDGEHEQPRRSSVVKEAVIGAQLGTDTDSGEVRFCCFPSKGSNSL